MRVKDWDYRELRERITNFYCEEVPKHDAFNRSFNRLTPATLKAINELIVEAAVKRGLEDGSKLRVDTTVVETDIHHPTDNTLLWDVVRAGWQQQYWHRGGRARARRWLYAADG
jgi:IS5 family transposase